MTELKTASQGIIGRLPAHADPIAQSLPQAFVVPWNLWLDQALMRSKEQLGKDWLTCYQDAPVWRFVLTPGIAGPDAWIGLMMPSVDSQEPYSPLALACRVGRGSVPFSLVDTAADWLDEAEGLVAGWLASDSDVGHMEYTFRSLGAPPSGTISTDAVTRRLGHSSGWHMALPAGQSELSRCWQSLLHQTLLDRFFAYSLWWRQGPRAATRSLVVCQGLPPPRGYAGFLSDGSPDGRGSRLDDAMNGRSHERTLPSGRKGWDILVSETPEPRQPWRSAGLSDKGCVRQINEDAFFRDDGTGIWAVADGMGGHEAGDLASRVVVNLLSEAQAPCHDGSLPGEIGVRLVQANTLLRLEAETRGCDVIASTVAVLSRVGHCCVVQWVGDSRVYLLRAGTLHQLSRDHSEVQRLVDDGLLDPAEAAHHPDASVLSRGIGGDDELRVDALMIHPDAGDRFLLCSDGVSRALAHDRLCRAATIGDPAEAAREIVSACIAGRAEDNVTVVVVDVPS